MRYYQKIQWLVVVFILLGGLVGCDSGDGGLTAPTDVPTGSASPANFWVGRGGDELRVYHGSGELQISVPKGAYMLTYVTRLGAFPIVFSSEEGAFFAIGLLEGDEFVDVFLQEGEIPDTAVPDPDYSKLGVNVYCWPGMSTPVVLDKVFIFTPASVTVIMVMQNGVFVTDNPSVVIVVLPEPIVVGPPQTVTVWAKIATGLGVVDPAVQVIPYKGKCSIMIYIAGGVAFDPALHKVYANGKEITGLVKSLPGVGGLLKIDNIHKDTMVEVYL